MSYWLNDWQAMNYQLTVKNHDWTKKKIAEIEATLAAKKVEKK